MRSLLIMLMACLLFGCPLARAQLSDEARADMYLVQAKEAFEKEDYAGAVRMLERIERLNLSMPNEFHYFYGKSLYKINANDKARQQLERYVNAVGRSGRYYNQTLSMLHDLEEKRRREQQAAEEQRRRAEEQRRREPQVTAIAEKMIRLPGGCFVMGSSASEPDAELSYGTETQHRVCVDAFEIGKYEVTQGEWLAVMGNNPPNFKNDHYPAAVGWDKVQAFLRQLNQRTGKNYRLPTEAEWEYACRGGATGERYCGGNEVDRVAWYDQNSSQIQPVGRKAANGFGLYDMSGNVWEWTCSLYEKSYSGMEKKCADQYTRGQFVVTRGGSYINSPHSVRSANRNKNPSTGGGWLTGFRLARSL